MNITILEIDGRPGQDAKVTFNSGSSPVAQTLFGPWEDIHDLEPGATYPVTFGTKLPAVAPVPAPAQSDVQGTDATGQAAVPQTSVSNEVADGTTGDTGATE